MFRRRDSPRISSATAAATIAAVRGSRCPRRLRTVAVENRVAESAKLNVLGQHSGFGTLGQVHRHLTARTKQMADYQGTLLVSDWPHRKSFHNSRAAD